MNTTYRVTIGDYIEEFLNGTKKGVATLKEIYKYVRNLSPETAEETIRCAIYRDRKQRFKRVAKGVYMVTGEKTASLIIEGDGRKLDEIEDESIDCIITDHPWDDSKSHKSGNQKNFADYDCFVYTQDDFNQKARVLKDGAFLAEFLPLENANNYLYLQNIKEMAKNAGFNYYAKVTWKKGEIGTTNTGRTTKEGEDIMIFYKGKKSRKLSEDRISGYRTKSILPFIIDIPIKKIRKTKKNPNIIPSHQAEKPIELYEFLIENLTLENEVCLDSFGGSLNLVKACVNKNRFGIAYEKCREFIVNGVKKFNAIKLYESEEYVQENDCSNECSEEVLNLQISLNSENNLADSETLLKDDLTVIEDTVKSEIPKEVTEFQLKFLNSIKEKRTHMLSSSDIDTINKANEDSFSLASTINELFNKIVKLGYSNYPVPVFDINLEDYTYLNQMEAEICNMFDAKFEDIYLKDYYTNYKIETRAFIEYCLSQKRIFTFESIKVGLNSLISDYIKYIQKNHTKLNYIRSEKLLKEFFA